MKPRSMLQIERAACAQYQHSGHNLQGPAPRASFRQASRMQLVSQIACFLIVIGVVVCVGIVLGAI
jgi:hypothetical protein